MPSPLSTFIDELRRRRVFRVAAFYGGIAFVIVQIIDGTFEVMGIPAWVSRLMIIGLAVGFPISMVLAWVFDITPEGIVRTGGRSTGKPGTSNSALIAVTIAAVAFGIWGRWGAGEVTGAIRSIAVLPLDNLMGDTEQDYFVDGMHEAIISNLSRIEALKVISRTSTLGYRNTDKRMPEIASELGVDAIVEGSVIKAANQVRITVQLISGRSDEHLWAADYVRDLVDILSLQNEVARAIANEIKISMTPEERTVLSENRKISPLALEEYLKGIHHWNKRTKEGFRLALGHFRASANADSTYAPSFAGLALTYQLLGEYYLMPISESSPQVIAFAEKALLIDPTLAEAHSALAAAQLYHLHDWAAAEAGYNRAIELNPGYATAYQWLAELNTFLGRYELALANIDKALSLDPLSNIMRQTKANVLTILGRHDEAIAVHEDRDRLYPGITPNTMWHVWALVRAGRFDEAVDLDLAVLQHFADPDGTVGAQLRASYEDGGFDAYAKKWIVVMDENSWEPFANWVWSLPWRHALAGEIDATIISLENELVTNAPQVLMINVLPDFKYLRDEPRFQAILKELDFPE